MREQNPIRFDFEASKLAGRALGSGRNWEDCLFSIVSEAVEVTALQRGVERWEPDGIAWVPRVVTVAPPIRDMFAIRIVGRSMEPKIPNGSLCVFRGGDAIPGTREGRIVLIALRDSVDPETGGRLTVKRYSSQKAVDEEGRPIHTRILLRPLNPDYQPIVIESAEEGTLRFVGEFVSVLDRGRA